MRETETSPRSTPPPARNSTESLYVDLIDGVATVHARDLRLAEGVQVDAADIAFPGLEWSEQDDLPVLADLKAQRGQLQYLRFSVREDALARLLESKQQSSERFRVKLVPGGVTVYAESESSPQTRRVLRGAVDTEEGRGFVLTFYDYRVFGPINEPPLALVGRLARSFNQRFVQLDGAARVTLAPHQAVLSAWLPPAGWKIPATDGLERWRVSLAGDRVYFTVSDGTRELSEDDSVSNLAAFEVAEASRLFVEAEKKLGAGELDAAAQRYRKHAASHPFAARRLLWICASRADLIDEAREVAEQLLVRNAKDPIAIDVRACLDLADGDIEQATEGFEWLSVRAVDEGDVLARVFADLTLGELLADRAPAEATAALSSALTLDPGNLSALRSLAASCARQGEWERAVEALETLLERLGDDDERLDVFLDLGDLELSERNHPERALEHYRAALDMDHANLRALNGLARAGAARGDAPGAIKSYDRVIELAMSAGDLTAAANAHVEIGRLWELALGRPENAVLRYEKALELDASHLAALESLWELRQQGLGNLSDSVATAQALGVALVAADENARAAEVWTAAAQALFDAGEDPDTAAAMYQSALEADPSHTAALEALADLYEQQGRGEALATSLQSAVERSEDPEIRARLLTRLAVVLESSVGDVEGAIAALEQAAAEALGSDAGTAALDQLLELSSRHGTQSQSLARVWERADPGPARARLALRIARNAARESDAPDDARTAAIEDWYRRVAAEDPNSVDAQEGLARAAEMRGDHEEALARWLQAVESEAEPQRRAQFRVEAARLVLEHLGDRAQARELATEALADDPDQIDVHRLAGTIQFLEGAWVSAIEHLERLAAAQLDELDTEEARTLASRLAEAHTHAEQLDDALTWRRRLMELSPDDTDNLRAAVAIAEKLEAWDDVVAVATRLLELDPPADPGGLAAEHVHLGRVYERHLEQPDAAREHYQNALDADADSEAYRLLSELESEAGNWDRVFELYQQLGARERWSSAEAHRQMARLALEMLEDDERAAVAYARLLELEPDAADALELLADRARVGGDWKKVADYLARLDEVRTDASDGDRARLKMARAEAAERLDQLGSAADLLSEAYALQPGRALLDERRRVLSALGRWSEVVETHEQDAEQLSSESQKANALVEAGRVAAERAEQPDRAIELLQRALELDDGCMPALDALEGLLEQQRGFSDLVSVLRKKAELLRGDGARQVELLARAAAVAFHELADAGLTESLLAEARGIDADDPRLLDLVQSMYEAEGRHEELAELLQHRAELADDAEESVRWMRAAARAAVRVGQRDTARDLLERAFEADPSDAQLEELLGELERSQAYERMAELLTARAERASSEADIATWWTRVAQHQREHLDSANAAVDALQRVLEVQPDDEDVFAALVETLVEAGRARDAAAALASRAERTAELSASLDLLRRAAYTYQFLARDDAAASKITSRLLELDPDDLQAREALAAMLEEQGDHEGAAEALQPLAAEATSNSTVARRYIGVLERAGRVDEAFAWYAQRARSGDTVAFEGLKSLAEHHDRFAELADLYEECAASLEGVEAARLYLAAARIHRTQTADMERSAACCRQALELAGNEPGIRGEALIGLEDAGDYQAVYRVLRESAVEEDRPELRRSMLERAAKVAEDLLGELRLAADALDELVRLDPDDDESAAASERLREQAEDWEGLAALYRLRAETAEGPRAAERWRALGILLRDRVEDARAACDALRKAVTADPADPENRRLLAEMLGAAGEWEELASRLARRADELEGDARAEALIELARIRNEQLDDANGAITALEEAVELQPENTDVASSLHKLLTREGRWNDVARLHADAARRLEQKQDELSAQELEEVHARRASAASVYMNRLQEHAAACAVLAEGFEGPDPEGALMSGVLLATEAGADGLLAALYEHAISHSAFAERKSELLHELGRIAKERLADPRGAIDAYRRAWELDASDSVALQQLENLYKVQGEWLPLADLYERAADAADGARKKADYLIELGFVRQKRLGDFEGARAAFEAASAADPDHERTLSALEGLYRASDDWGALAELYMSRAAGSGDPAEQVRLYLQAGDLLDGALQDVEAALRAYRAAHEVAADPEPVLARMEELMRRSGDSAGLAEVLALRAGSASDPKAALQALLEMADVQRKQGDLEGAAATLMKARDRVPTAREPLARLRRIKRLTEDWLGLDALLAEEEQMAPAGAEAGALARERGVLARDVLGEDQRARDHFRRALELDPNSAQTAADLAEVAERIGDRGSAALALERLAEAGDDSVDRYSVLLRAAEHLESSGSRLRATELLERAVVENPEQLTAWDRLAAYEEEAGQWEEARVLLAELLARASHAGQTEVTIDVYFRLGRAERRLDHLDQAISRLERVLMADESHREALDELIEALRAKQDAGPLAEALTRAADLSEDAATAAGYLREVGQIYDRDLGRPDAAFQAYRRSVDADASDLPALRRLADLSFDLARYQDFLNTMELLAPKETAPARALSLAWRAGESLRKLERNEEAAEQFERALELDANHYPSYVALGQLREEAEDWARAVAAYEGALRTLPEEETERAGPLHARRGDLFAEHLGDPEAAATEYARALEIDPDDVDLRLKLAGVYARAKGRTADALREYQRLVGSDPFRLVCYRALADIYERSQNLDRAFGMYSIIALLDPKDDKARAFLDANRAKIQQGVQQGLMTPLSPEDHDELVMHPEAKGPLGIFVQLASRLLTVWKPKDITVGARQLQETDNVPILRTVETLRARLGIPGVSVWLRPAAVEAKRASVGDLIQVTSGDPPPLMIDETLRGALDDSRAVLFLLGKMLERLRGGHELFCRMKGVDLIQLVQLFTRIVDPETEVKGLDEKEIAKRLGILKKLVPRNLRKPVEAASQELARQKPDPLKWVRALQHSENRVGLLICADVSQAARALLALDPALSEQDLSRATRPASLLRRSPAVVELLRFASSDAYFELRRRTGLSLDQRLRG